MSPAPSRNIFWRRLIVLLLSVAVLAYLLGRISLRDIADLLRAARPLWLLPALGLYMLSQVIRGWRFWSLTRGHTPLPRLSAIAALQSLLLTVLPMRTGEVSFVALLAREPAIGVTWAGKITVAVRLMDLAVVTGIFLVASQYLPATRVPLPVLLPAVALMLLCVGLVIFPQVLARMLRPPALWLVRRTPLRRLRVAARAEDLLERALTVTDPAWFRSLLPLLWLQSLLLWPVALAVTYAALQALGVHLGLAEAFYLGSVLTVSSVLPIYGPAGYGAQDAIGAALLVGLGVAQAQAVAAQLSWHTLSLVVTLVTGGLGWVYLWRKGPPAGPAD